MPFVRTRLAFTVATALTALLGGFTPSADAAAPPGPVTVPGSHPDHLTAAEDAGRIPTTTNLTARLYLGTRDPIGLDAFLTAVTTPTSPHYRHYLTPAQYGRRFGLAPSARNRITRWLTSAGLRITEDTPHYLQLTGSEAHFATALGTRIHRYDTSAGTVQAPVDDIRVPAPLAQEAKAVDGLSFNLPAAARPLGRTEPHLDTQRTVCSAYFGERPATTLPKAYGKTQTFAPCPYTPPLLRHAYGVTASGATGRGRTIAIVGAYGSPTTEQDANTYATTTGDRPFQPGQYRERVSPSDWNITKACAPPASWAGEQALDVEMAHGYAPGARILYVGANSCLDTDLMDAESYVIDHHAADIISNSWAEVIHTSAPHLTPALLNAWNALFRQAAAEGIGTYFAAGDCGDQSPDATPGGLNCDPHTTQAQADFPSGSPWVTSIGGTTLATTKDGRYAWETSMGDNLSILSPQNTGWEPIPGLFTFGSGGGPSDFKQPWYQRGTVPHVLAHGHRATPDVSMEGDGAIPVVIGYTVSGQFETVGYGGTSAAAPAFAALQADAEQLSGHTLGFANPLLYAMRNTGVFHDIRDPVRPTAVIRDMGPDAGTYRYLLYTLGHDYGLSATKGYDLSSGLGSPAPSYLGRFRRHSG
ncbi:S8/S53 family peptidase [Streptomyces sp. KC 17012]|uniref:S53 family peptidase n=1 Tax=Streptomyces plumbidurans TaxID=2814589 RepID=UPI001C9DD52B|nr:S53 family peptidase [Streptomyces plumbidurans]MBY8344426.1 S8/S53 family peptidase [Streptomyces plumbidurans]